MRAAYGLELAGDVEVAGATAVPADAIRGRVAVSHADASSAREPGLERLFTQDDGRGGEAAHLERVAAGYRMRIADLAEFTIAGDGTGVVCRPEIEPAWRWQRVLAGHALPMAALLQGVEVLHAAAVALDAGGRRVAVAIAARPQGGKSSLSVNLALQGASLMTDDALAVEVLPDGSILAHPGVGAATIRWPEAERLRERGLLDRLQVVGESPGGVRVLLNRADAPAPLAAVYWPERDPSISRPEFIRLEPDPRPLLAATINLVVRDPERLRRHFEVSTAIAAAVPLFRIGIPQGMDAASLAEAITEHAGTG